MSPEDLSYIRRTIALLLTAKDRAEDLARGLEEFANGLENTASGEPKTPLATLARFATCPPTAEPAQPPEPPPRKVAPAHNSAAGGIHHAQHQHRPRRRAPGTWSLREAVREIARGFSLPFTIPEMQAEIARLYPTRILREGAVSSCMHQLLDAGELTRNAKGTRHKPAVWQPAPTPTLKAADEPNSVERRYHELRATIPPAAS